MFSTACLAFNPSSSARTETIIMQGIAACRTAQIKAFSEMLMPAFLSNTRINNNKIGARISLLKLRMYDLKF